ncbi:MAG: GAF domain-containing protein [Thermoleophilia bacterium]|nr:GAF domain-containing protein [Thermoleophilia bacterium]
MASSNRHKGSDDFAPGRAEDPVWKKNLFEMILTNIDDGVSVQDRNMRIIYANAAHKRAFGEDLEGRYCYQVYQRRPRICPGCAVEMVYKTGKPFRTIHHGYDKNGKKIASEIIATPVFDDNGEIVAGVEVVRFITDQLKAESELTEKSRRLEKLIQVAGEISSGLDMDEILGHVVKNAVELSGADAGAVSVIDEKSRRVSIRSSFNYPEELESMEFGADEGVFGSLMKSGEALVLRDYHEHPDHVEAFARVFEKFGVHSLMLVPMIVGKKQIGALGLFMTTPNRTISEEAVETTTAIANQAAVAIQNANLYAETSNGLRIQQELNKVAISITSGLDLGRVLQEVARRAAEIANADSAMIALIDEDSGVISFPYAHNLPVGLCQVTSKAGDGVAGKVISECEPRIDNDYQASDLRHQDFANVGVTAVASVPLMIADRCVGAIGVMDKGSGRRFTEDDINVLTIISRQAAVAVENARLYGELSRSTQKLELRVKDRTEALSRMYQESERKSRDLEEANLKLREVDRMKSEFLANMSHELRTPLNSIIGFSKLILDGLDGETNEEQKKDLEIVHSNGLQLLHLIDDLLNLARIEAGRINLVLQPAMPGDVVDEVLMGMRPIAREKGLELEYSPPAELEPVVMDAGKVRQVLQNLLSNAIKFTEAGRIEVSVEQSSSVTVFSVKDPGRGISKDEAGKIFDRFHQSEPGLAGTAGVGLGLTISKRFVDMHKGNIQVTSEPEMGSVFSFTIPHNLSVAT